MSIQQTKQQGVQPKMQGLIIRDLEVFTDSRGHNIELIRKDEFKKFLFLMAYHSVTKPQVVRGPHEHEKQTDNFFFVGPGDFELHVWDNRPGSEFPLETHEVFIVGSSRPAQVTIPPGIVHGYKNISHYEGVVINMPDKLYRGINKEMPVDEIRWESSKASPFKIN